MEQAFGGLDFDGCTRLADQRPQARCSVSARTPFMSCSSARTPHARKNITTRACCLMRTSPSLLRHSGCYHARTHAHDNEQHEQPRTADRSAHGHDSAAGSLRSCVRLVASGHAVTAKANPAIRDMARRPIPVVSKPSALSWAAKHTTMMMQLHATPMQQCLAVVCVDCLRG